MRVAYNCANSRCAIRDYYLRQTGHGLPSYGGVRYQKGHGFFSSLFRFAVPILKRAGIGVAKQLLSTGSNIISDVEKGQSLKQSAKARFAEAPREAAISAGKSAISDAAEAGKNAVSSAGKNIFSSLLGNWGQKGSGIKRKKNCCKKSQSSRSKRRKVASHSKDIFS